MQNSDIPFKELDEWELKLEDMLLELKNCQESKTFKSCFDCIEFFECELRKKYIVSVYESMNKGSSGGFEF